MDHIPMPCEAIPSCSIIQVVKCLLLTCEKTLPGIITTSGKRINGVTPLTSLPLRKALDL